MLLVRRLVAATAAIVMVAAPGAAAAAQAGAGRELPRLTSEITDEAGLLGVRRSEVERSLADARARGVHLHVVLTGTTGGAPASEWSRTVALANGMGGDDALLVVVLDDRQYGLWLSDALTEITDAERDRVLTRSVEPLLASGDFAGAVSVAADGLANAHEGRTAGGSPGRSLLPLLGLVAAAVLLWWLVSAVRRAGGARRAAEERDRRTGQLARTANVALVEADDAVRDAERDLLLAEGQFGEEEVAPLRHAVGQAHVALQEAFSVRQRLDDQPPGHDERVQLLETIVAGATHARELVAEEQRRLEELQDLERNAPSALAAARARIDVVRAALGQAEIRERALAPEAPEMVEAVAGNLVEAAKRLDAATEMAAAADGHVKAGRTVEAAPAIRRLQDTVAQAAELVDTIGHLAEKLEKARAAVGGELEEAELAVARAADFIRARRGAVGRVARTRLAEAERHLTQGHALRRDDPEAAIREADEAERLGHEAYRLARDDADRGDRRGMGGGTVVWPMPFPVPMGGRRRGGGWGGTAWGGGLGGRTGGGGFGGRIGGGGFGGGGRVGGGRF